MTARLIIEATFDDDADADRAKGEAEDAVWKHNGEIDSIEIQEDS